MSAWQSRLLGFFTSDDLERLSECTIFVPGCGAIGSAVLQVLARTGVGRFIIADFDEYAEENLPGQLFCDRRVLGHPKVEVVGKGIRLINPKADVELFGRRWSEPATLDSILRRTNVAVLGLDTLGAGVFVYREARRYKVPVVDFYYSTALSVFVTRPGDPTPEERFDYPTRAQPWTNADSPELAGESLLRLTAFVLMNCPWLTENMLPSVLREFLMLGKIPVLPSLVVMAGAIMAEQALSVMLDRPAEADYRGWFFDWRTQRALAPLDPTDSLALYGQTLARLRELRDSGAA
jgi:molybdopterin/thiamine biosynthesis adenylyltransferase